MTAVVKDIRAAIAEQASLGEAEQGWHHTGNSGQPLLFLISAQYGNRLQQPDGIKVPKVLIPYTGFEMIS